jgi:hypothetical protein
MRTAYCPKTHTKLASVSVGTEFGHVPGHQYSDVDVVVSHRPGKTCIRCHVVQSWGSAQGYDEEHGRHEVMGRGLTVDGACSDALAAGQAAGMNAGKLHEAISQARDQAEEALADAAEPILDYFTCEGSVRGPCGHKHGTHDAAQRCIDRDQYGCASQGGYSDRHVVAVDSDGSRRQPTEAEAGL